MIQILLGGKEVIPQSNTAIKLIRENPFFTKSGSSTLSIILPMQIEQNIKVLGHLNRLDYLHKPTTFPATIKENNKVLITGEAVVIDITESNVKIQILGGTSLMNFHNKMDNIYIDELDLGKWGMSYIGGTQSTNTVYSLFYYTIWTAYISDISMVGREEAQRRLRERLFGQNNEWVAFPIYNETSCVMCNDWILRSINIDGVESIGENGYFIAPRNNIDDWPPNGDPQVRFVVQPYLLPMVERVFNALGYSIDISSLKSNELFSKIFIASANERAYRNKSLPHWSVKEFITQLEYFFGATFDVDEEKKHITIMRRSDYIHRGEYEVNDILDEFSISNEDNKNALKTSNVGYEEVEPFAKIEPWIVENAKHKYYATYSEYLDDYLSGDDLFGAAQNYYNRYKGYIIHIEETGIEMVCKNPNGSWFEGGPAIANYLKDRIVKDNNSELDIELKIVPVKIVTENGKMVYSRDASDRDEEFINLIGDCYYMSAPDYPVRTWEEARATTEENVIVDVEAAINGEETFDDSKDDLMRVAINANAYSIHNSWFYIEGLTSISSKYPKPIVFSSQKECDINGEQNIAKYGLNVCDGLPEISIATEVFDSEPLVRTEKKYCIKFLTNEMLNPSFRFKIHNQVFLCERLEYQIKSTEVEKLVTGYFYRLEE